MDQSANIDRAFQSSADNDGCPTAEELSAYAQGRLPSQLLARIDKHLSICDTCAESLRGLTDTETSAGSGAVLELPVSETESLGDAPQLMNQRYRLLRLLGRGKFGSVFLARDIELDRDVAIKLPRRASSSSADIEPLLREARAAARMKHPGIVSIYDVGRTDDGTCFIAMEYVSGKTLRAVMDSETVSPEQAAMLIEQAAHAIHFAHQQGLIHRDIKPANLLRDQQGHVRVSDFGLAVHEDRQWELIGNAAGTPTYMAPEQVRGEAQWLDGRTDIWSLGAVLYELLAGRRPFSGNREQLFDNILHRPPKPPRQIRDTIPPPLERICLKCLAKDVGDRYSNAADLAADLAAFRKQKPRWQSVAARLSVLILAVMLGVALTLLLRGDRSSNPVNETPLATLADLADVEPFVWHEMLSPAPEQLLPQMWAHERWQYDTVQQTLWIDSPSWQLLATGTTTSDSFDIQTEFTKNVVSGASGIFLGYEPVPPSDKLPAWRCHCIIVHNRTGNEINVERQSVVFQQLSFGGVAVKTKSLGVIRVPRVLIRGARLDVSVRLGRVTEVRWQGQPIPELCDKELHHQQEIPHSKGKLGVMNSAGATTFSSVRYMSQEAKP